MNKIEELIKLNELLIYKIASKFHNIPTEDLYQAGCIGVIKAYNNFKENNNAKFSTYAYNYIFGEMYELANNLRNIKLNKDILKLSKKIEQAKLLLCQKLEHEPSITELSKYLNISEQVIYEIYNLTNKMMSLDANVEKPIYEIIPDKDKDISLKIDLEKSIKNLSHDEQKIIELRYFKDLTQIETAQTLGISQVKVSRYEKKCLTKMYNYLST